MEVRFIGSVAVITRILSPATACTSRRLDYRSRPNRTATCTVRPSTPAAGASAFRPLPRLRRPASAPRNGRRITRAQASIEFEVVDADNVQAAAEELTRAVPQSDIGEDPVVPV